MIVLSQNLNCIFFVSIILLFCYLNGSVIDSSVITYVAKKKTKLSGTDSGEENMSKKDLALHQAIDHITSAFGKGAIMWLGRSQGHREVPVISTGSFALDMALGTGGFPKVCFLISGI
jgi:recombination protein RecA